MSNRNYTYHYEDESFYACVKVSTTVWYIHNHPFDSKDEALQLVKRVKEKGLPDDHFDQSPHWKAKIVF